MSSINFTLNDGNFMKLSIALRHWRLPHLRIKFLVVSNDNMTVVQKSKMIVTVMISSNNQRDAA